MADDSLDHHVSIDILSREELEQYLRSYLPQVGNDPSLWAICSNDDSGLNKVIFYFYRHRSLSYFIDALEPCQIKDGTKLLCRLFIPKWVETYDDFPKEGDFIFRVRRYLEGGSLKGISGDF